MLGWLSRNKRVTWTFVSEHAQVLDYDGRRLVLGISPTRCQHFRQGPHADWCARPSSTSSASTPASRACQSPKAHRFRPVKPDPGGAGTSPSPQSQASPAETDQAAPTGDPGLASAARHVPESSAGWASAPSAPGSAPSWATEPSAPAPEFSDAESAPQMSHLERAKAAVKAEGPAAAQRVRVADDSAASDDDEDIEGLGEVGRPVIERILGGRVIDEA